jgi:hypothetical protein
LPPPYQSKKACRVALQKAKNGGGTSIRRDSSIVVVSQNAQGMKDPAKLETIIYEEDARGIYAYLVQETWLEGDFVQKLKYGQTLIRRGLERQESRRGSGGGSYFK